MINNGKDTQLWEKLMLLSEKKWEGNKKGAVPNMIQLPKQAYFQRLQNFTASPLNLGTLFVHLKIGKEDLVRSKGAINSLT